MRTDSAASGQPIAHVLFAGRTTVDAVYRLDALPQEDTKVFASALRLAPGGPACNAAITHACLGGRTTLISAVGSGPLAAFVRAHFERRGIALVDLAAGSSYETPLTTVLLNTAKGTRTIVNPPPVGLDLPECDWSAAWTHRPSVALTDGFYLDALLPAFAGLRQNGTALCLDGGRWKPGTDTLAPLLTAAICSERFALPGKPAEAETTLAWFAAQGVPFVAVTRGARPILALDRGHRFEVEIRSIEAVDTLGAGDVLHGAFCYHFSLGGNFEESLRRAAEIATRSCEGPGIADWAGAPLEAGPFSS